MCQQVRSDGVTGATLHFKSCLKEEARQNVP